MVRIVIQSTQMNKMYEGFRRCIPRRVMWLFTFIFVIYIGKTTFKYTKSFRYEYRNPNVMYPCVIPDSLSINDEEIAEYLWKPSPLNCSTSLSLIFVDSKGFIRYNTSAIEASKLGSVTCAYSIFVRKAGDDDDVEMQQEVTFMKPVYVPGDVFLVKCVDKNNKVVYKDLHQSIHFQPILASKNIKVETRNQLSVYIFGIDSVSRYMAMRKLVKTMKYLQEELGAITMKGTMKVGENTRPNNIALLSGKKVWELKINSRTDYYDDVSLIWKNFSDAGYVTMLSEDLPEFTTFNYLAKGFNKQPCDHYQRPFYLAMSKLDPTLKAMNAVSLFLEDWKIMLKKHSSLCYGNRAKHNLFIEYFKRFVDSYKGRLKFVFSFLTEISHDYINFLELMDEDLMQFFKWLKENGHLDNSVLIFMSDHGSRIGKIRNTALGRIEVNMPIVSIVMPEHFKKDHPVAMQNLVSNTNVLTSHFDIHRFFLDIVNRNFSQTSRVSSGARGTSLLQKIPISRTCADAAVPENFCACYSSKKVNVTDPVIKPIALYLVETINDILRKVRDKCTVLSLDSVKYANVIQSGFQRYEKDETPTLRRYFSKPKELAKRYSIIFQTVPGNATFEGIVEVDSDTSMKVVGDIARTNRYGKQSICVEDRLLRLYCFCRIEE